MLKDAQLLFPSGGGQRLAAALSVGVGSEYKGQEMLVFMEWQP